MSFFLWLEATAISEWIRGSPSLWGFPFILYLHTLGLALLAGLSSALALWLLTTDQDAPKTPFLQLFPVMWIGFGINAVSGLLLLIAYPAKALTNPVFYIKLIAIAVAVGILQWMQRQLRSQQRSTTTSLDTIKLKRAAISLLGLWLTATLTGRLLAYTYSILMARETLYF